MLVEPDSLLREALTVFLQRAPELQLLGTVADGEECVQLAYRVVPQLVVAELHRGQRPDLTWLTALRSVVPEVRVLVLSATCTDECIHCALAAGVHGYVLKDARPDELLQAARSVIAGLRHYSEEVSARVLARYLEPAALARRSNRLTTRERDILARIAQGDSNSRIASALGVSIKTIEKHRGNLMRKLDLHDTAQVTRYAVRQGLLAARSFDAGT